MKSGKEQTLKQRATGLEKSQDRPKHTDLKTLQENETITKSEQDTQQQSSSSTGNDIDRNNFDVEHELPVVDALATPNPGVRSTLAHMNATVTKLQDTEQRIKNQATYIQELEFQLRLQEAYTENLLKARTISSLPSAPPALSSAHETDIKEDEHAIQQLRDSLALKKQAYTQQQRTQSPVLMVPESPGPHRLQPRPERPQDVTLSGNNITTY